MDTVIGTNTGETLTANNGSGTNTKYDGKGGDDIIKGSTGNDLIIGGAGSDYMFGGLGADTFQFSKFANNGDHDWVVDFNLALGDKLDIFNGATIVAANAAKLGDSTHLGQDLVNDANVWDLTLTLRVVDGEKNFDYQVTLLDVIKNQTWSASEMNVYLESLGYTGGISFGASPA
ncbi:hypothetical protein [Sphingobium xenophagum]|uniref:Surface adhesion protein n=1 Tax=Sphingobium xenophagum TaxID=121428 RepID=A0A401J6A6_SPHXE|nr:hypothetical protein [Sphingobium xenophagum]GBH32192.1 surface adhesion protein [Sphingobium xenophagum]